VQAVPIADPTWNTTFPHRVAPRAQEWLAGVLLRCDEANGWDSGATITYLLRTTQVTKEVKKLGLALAAPVLDLHTLAGWLAVSEPALRATTYQAELARLYANPTPHIQKVDMGGGFHFCLECITEERMLRRTLVLPHIRCCPLHHVQLQSRCSCLERARPPETDIPGLDPLLQMIYEVGVAQRLFSPGKKPMTCRRCGLDWADFPRLKADPERLILEQKILAWYDFFFKGTRGVLTHALRVINQTLQQRHKKSVKRLSGRTIPVTFSSPERTSLGHLVDVLVSLELTPSDVETDETPLLWWPINRQTFYCPVPACPYRRPTDAGGDEKR